MYKDIVSGLFSKQFRCCYMQSKLAQWCSFLLDTCLVCDIKVEIIFVKRLFYKEGIVLGLK